MCSLFIFSTELSVVSNSNGVNSNLRTFNQATGCTDVSNSNGVNSNIYMTRIIRTIKQFQTPTE